MKNILLVAEGTNVILKHFENCRLDILIMLRDLLLKSENKSIDTDIILINKESERFVDEYVISRIYIKDNELYYDSYESQEDRDNTEIQPYSQSMFDFISMDELFEILINLQKKCQ